MSYIRKFRNEINYGTNEGQKWVTVVVRVTDDVGESADLSVQMSEWVIGQWMSRDVCESEKQLNGRVSKSVNGWEI